MGVLSACVFFSVPSFAKTSKLPTFSGSIDDRYTLRTTGALRDQDLETFATLSIGTPSVDRFSAFLEGGGIFDLDGRSTTTTYSSLSDSFSERATGRLYSASMDVRRIDPIELIRVGRQHRADFENLYFDGISFDSMPFYGLVLSGYGGVPVHLYETETGFDPGDWLAGGALQWNPIAQVRFRFDYSHIKDDAGGPRAGQGDSEDDLLAVSLWADPTDTIDLYGRFSTFSDEVRDVEVGSTFDFPKQGFTLRASVYRLLEGYDIRVFDLDAYQIVGVYQPYTDLRLSATKQLGAKFSLDGGVAIRMLDHTQIASSFNHGFERVYLSFSAKNLFTKGLSFSATGDYYHGEDNILKDDTFGQSFDVSYASKRLLNNRLKMRAGTAFYLYRYNTMTNAESENVQTYFASLEGKLTKTLTLKTSYELENNDLNKFHTLTSRLSWEF